MSQCKRVRPTRDVALSTTNLQTTSYKSPGKDGHSPVRRRTRCLAALTNIPRQTIQLQGSGLL
jgi:hypothetical protein